MYSTALATRPDIAPPGSSGLSRDIVSILLPAFAIEGDADLADLDLGQSVHGPRRPCLGREKQPWLRWKITPLPNTFATVVKSKSARCTQKTRTTCWRPSAAPAGSRCSAVSSW